MIPRQRVAALVVTLFVGFILGQWIAGQPETEYKVIHDTETKTVTEYKEVPTAPPVECAKMVQLATDIMHAGSQYDETTADLLEIMSLTRIAAATGDSNAANDLETQLRDDVMEPTDEAAETLGQAKAQFEEAQASCMKAINRE